jgi:uncharacterized membrane protein
MSIPLPSVAPEHIHPILVNFTAALVPASFGSDVLGKIVRRQSLHAAGFWMLIYAAAITPFTAIAGLIWKRSVASALPPEQIAMHQWLGISLAVLFLVAGAWRWKLHARDITPGFAYLGFCLLLVVALMYQGALGGQMAFGG